MIVSEIYERENATPLLHIYSDERFFLRLKNQLVKDGYVDNEQEIQNYTETNIPLPSIKANNDFICSVLIYDDELTEDQILKAKPILNEALNLIEEEKSYYLKFLYPTLDIEYQYKEGERFQYNNNIYVTIQEAYGKKLLDSDNSTYFKKINCPIDFLEEWKTMQEYNLNDRIKYGSHVYVSLIDHNTWSPQDFPAAWQLEKRSQD
jgi:hypothetical protein